MSIINDMSRISSERINVQTLFQNNNRLLIDSAFQRNYEWGESEITELLDELLIIIKEQKNGKLSYLNLIYVCNPEIGKHFSIDDYIIIDGQQRITTIFLLLTYLSYKDKTSKFEPFYSDNDKQCFLCHTHESKEDEFLYDMCYKLQKDFRYIEKLEIAEMNSIEKKMAIIIDFINDNENSFIDTAHVVKIFKNRIFFTKITVPYEYAATIFIDLNSKGKRLDIIDNCKPAFSSLMNMKEKEEFAKKFNDLTLLIEKIQNDGLKSRTKGETEKELIFKWNVQAYDKGKNYCDNDFQLSDKFLDYVVGLDNNKKIDFIKKAIQNCRFINENIQEEKNSTYAFLKSISSTGYSYYPLLIVANNYLSSVDYKKFILLLNKIYLYDLIKNGTAGGRREFYSNVVYTLMRKFHDGENLDDIKKWYTTNYNLTKDELLTRLKFLHSYKNKKTILNLFIFLEANISEEIDHSCDFIYISKECFSTEKNKQATIEHILSENNMSKFIEETWGQGIGNLTILSKTDNCKLQDKQDLKHKIYSESNYVLSYGMVDPNAKTKEKGKKISKIFIKQFSNEELCKFDEGMAEKRALCIANVLYKSLSINESLNPTVYENTNAELAVI